MTHSTRYRMYVDESGDHVMDPSKWSSTDARYLGLTGVVIASDTYRTRTHREFEALKQEFFPHDPDYPVILVRQQITQKRGIFRTLQDPDFAVRREERILQFFDTHVSLAVSVVLDKLAYQQLQSTNYYRPYSYCVNALCTRYVDWLARVGGAGDVIIEARRGKADAELREDFHKFVTENICTPGSHGNPRVVDGQPHLKLKSNNITGLQLADLFAYPSMRGALLESGRSMANRPSHTTLRFYEAVQAKSDKEGAIMLP